MDHGQLVEELTRRAAAAADRVAELATDVKNAGLQRGLAEPLVERLTLNRSRIAAMARGLREVAALPDPVGEVSGMWNRPSGLQVGRMRIPLGVIFVIFESRPNVTVDVGGLCLKSGNAALLRGGSEAIHSNTALADVLSEALAEVGIPKDAIQLVPRTDRELVDLLLKRDDRIDLVVPRGGEALIRRVNENSCVPVIKHYKGVCHVYVDEYADPKLARDIAVNSKCQRVSVCNAAETLLIHAAIARDTGIEVLSALAAAGVELRGCERTVALFPDALPATDADWGEEYLDKILAVRIVESMDQAIEHIREHGSDHTESIVTRDVNRAREFVRRVNSSSVLVNASTRFSDGYEFGLGAEIGISTSKMHWYGPMGLEGLTTQKFIAFGDGTLKE